MGSGMEQSSESHKRFTDSSCIGITVERENKNIARAVLLDFKALKENGF